jgi:PAS domain S-box-containing protein
MFSSLKVPVSFLVIGICWAVVSNPIITFFFRHLAPTTQDDYRSLNDLVFVIIISIVLHIEIKKRQQKLSKSEEEYRQLFESNPNPLWIYSTNSLRFVNVNNAAIKKYGYSKRKFLKMNFTDIQPGNQSEKFKNKINNNDEGLRLDGVVKHINADGGTFDVSVISHPVLFRDQHCNMVMATDLTELLEKDRKLEEAYEKLKIANETLLHIAWSNSHELRKPLCSILSLTAFLKESTDKQESQEFLDLLEISSTELDQILRHNSEKVNEIELLEKL